MTQNSEETQEEQQPVPWVWGPDDLDALKADLARWDRGE